MKSYLLVFELLQLHAEQELSFQKPQDHISPQHDPEKYAGKIHYTCPFILFIKTCHKKEISNFHLLKFKDSFSFSQLLFSKYFRIQLNTLGSPPVPRAISKANEPVEITGTVLGETERPSHISAPFPKEEVMWSSACCSASSFFDIFSSQESLPSDLDLLLPSKSQYFTC